MSYNPFDESPLPISTLMMPTLMKNTLASKSDDLQTKPHTQSTPIKISKTKRPSTKSPRFVSTSESEDLPELLIKSNPIEQTTTIETKTGIETGAEAMDDELSSFSWCCIILLVILLLVLLSVMSYLIYIRYQKVETLEDVIQDDPANNDNKPDDEN